MSYRQTWRTVRLDGSVWSIGGEGGQAMRSDQSQRGQPTRTRCKQATVEESNRNVVLTEEVVTNLPLDENDGKHKVDML